MVAIPDIGRRTGPQLFGFLLNYMLMGALAVQVYHYYVSFPDDRRRVKTIVYTIFALEIVQTILMGYSSYRIFGSGYGDLDALDEIQVDWFSVCILGSTIPGMVEAFYASRLYRFSGSKLAAGVIYFLAFTQTVAGIVQGAFSYLTQHNSQLTSKPYVVILWMCAGVSCDILIAVFMSYYLKRRQSEVLSRKMNNTITQIVRYTVETGAITAVVAVVLLVLFLATPTEDYYAVPNRPLAKLYSNNLLVLLNTRAIVIGGRSDITTQDINEIKFNTAGNITAEPLSTTGERSSSQELTKLPSASSSDQTRTAQRNSGWKTESSLSSDPERVV